MGDLVVDVAVHLHAEHAEGPMWDEATARLWWVDITGQRVHCFDPASDSSSSWRTPGQPGGVVVDTMGEPVVATPEGLAVLDRVSGGTTVCAPVEDDRPENRANDAKVDSRGRVWVGTMALDKSPGRGALYRVEGATVKRVVDGLTICNGPAFDEEDGRMYLADTAIGTVDVFDLDPGSGELSARRPFLDFSDTGVWPDGMTVDDEGMLWIALGRAGTVHRYDRAGRLDSVVELPTSNPTSVAFGGVERGDLYITSSWFDLEPDDRVTQPLAGAIFRCRPGVAGPPPPRYRRRFAAGATSDGPPDPVEPADADPPASALLERGPS